MTQRLVCLLLVLVLAATAGCASSREDRGKDPAENARRLYEDASDSMLGGNFAAAISAFENLTAIYPFSEEARQARLDLMYAYWRNEQPDSAIAAADRFILENPTHPRVDYALYMKGLARFPPNSGALEQLFRHDKHLRPPGEMQNAFNTFGQLLQQHPDSEYGGDGIAPVAAEGAAADPDAGRRLAALVLVALDQPSHAPHHRLVEAARHDLGHRPSCSM
jgi:outer membrane protein assembly factor BamD